MECKFCDGMGFFDADFDYDLGRYVPYGPACEDCEGSGQVDEVQPPEFDGEAESFDRGYEAGFNVGLQASEDHGKDQGFSDARYLIACAYAEMILDGVTQCSPIVHDVFERLFAVLDGEAVVPDYMNWGSDVK